MPFDRMITFGRIAGIDTAQMPSGSEQPSRQAEQSAQTGKKRGFL